MKRLLLIPFLLLLSASLSAQKNIKPGYIVNLQGDTIKGFINYRDWDNSPKTIVFGIDPSHVNTKYSVHQIKGFGVLAEVYQSKIVQINTGPYKTKDLTFDTELSLKSDTVFVQPLMLGKKSLFFYKDEIGRENFYILTDRGVELLIFQEYKKTIDDLYATTIVGTNNKYIGQLMIYLIDCQAIRPQIEKTLYTRKSLFSLFKAYNKCENIPETYELLEEELKDEAGIIAGLTFTKLSFEGKVRDFLTKAEYPVSVSPTLGGFYNFVFKRNLKKWSLNNMLLYAHYATKGSYTETRSANNIITTTTEFTFNYLKLNNMLTYTFPFKKYHFCIEAGISNGLVIGYKTHLKEETLLFNTQYLTEGKAVEAIRNLEQCYLIGFGMKYKQYGLSYLYEDSNGFSDYVNLYSKVIRHSLVFSYTIF